MPRRVGGEIHFEEIILVLFCQSPRYRMTPQIQS
jgi:hypothetical protein